MEQRTAPVDHKNARKAAFGSFVGAVVEWYDFLLYGIVAALIFNHQFFPNVSPAIGTIAAFATFGVGFLFRPLGAMFFGHFGDKLGRKRMLVWTMTIMGVTTMLIGLLPNFESIGYLAPIGLVVLRAVQGFAVGGEWGGAALMAVESAPPKRKAFYSSGVQVGFSVGLLLSTGAVSLVGMAFDDSAFQSWAWRLPFLFSGVLVAVGLWVRAGVSESRAFEEAKTVEEAETAAGIKKRLPLVEAITRHPKAFFQIIALRLAELFTMYIVTTFALNYSTASLGYNRSFFLNIALLVGALGIVSIPFFAHLSDRIGRRPIFVTGALLGLVFAVPFFVAMEQEWTLVTILCAVILINVAHDMVVSVQQPLITEMFGARYRYSGAGMGYQVASAIGGGFTPFIAASLVAVSGGSWHWVAGYLAVGCLVSALVAAKMKHTEDDDRVEIGQTSVSTTDGVLASNA